MFKSYRRSVDFLLVAATAMAKNKPGKALDFLEMATRQPDFTKAIKEINQSNKTAYSQWDGGDDYLDEEILNEDDDYLTDDDDTEDFEESRVRRRLKKTLRSQWEDDEEMDEEDYPEDDDYLEEARSRKNRRSRMLYNKKRIL